MMLISRIVSGVSVASSRLSGEGSGSLADADLLLMRHYCSTALSDHRRGISMPAYLIVNYNVENPELYASYSAAAGPVMKIGKACKLVAFDPASDRLEGETAGHQTIILQFESKEEARALYESDEYQALIPKRHAATSHHFAILVNGVPG